MSYPEELELYSDTIAIIRYIMSDPSLGINIRLNPESDSDLECENLIGMKKCSVSLDHFKNKQSGYYYTHHLNHLGEYSIYHEANPINIYLSSWKTNRY